MQKLRNLCVFTVMMTLKRNIPALLSPKHSLFILLKCVLVWVFVCFVKLPVCIWLFVFAHLTFLYLGKCVYDFVHLQVSCKSSHYIWKRTGRKLAWRVSLSVASWLFLCLTRTAVVCLCFSGSFDLVSGWVHFIFCQQPMCVQATHHCAYPKNFVFWKQSKWKRGKK